MDPIFKASCPPLNPDDELLPLLLRVAQRADQLAHTAPHNATRDRETWERAESEFLPTLALPAVSKRGNLEWPSGN